MNTGSELKRIAPLDASDDEIINDAKVRTDDQSTVRRSFIRRMSFNAWNVRGRQWIKRNLSLNAGAEGYNLRFEEKYRYGSEEADRPVVNFLSKGVRTEVANIIRKQYIPKVVPEDRSQKELREGADLAEKKLKYNLKVIIPWWRYQEAWAHDLCEVGTCIGCSYLDTRDDRVRKLPAPNAALCPRCNAMFGDTYINSRFLEMGIPGGGEFYHQDNVGREGLPENTVQMRLCPICQEPSELNTEWGPLGEELDLTDVFGNQLGREVPKVEPKIDYVNWSELYPENEGVGVEPDACRQWVRKRVVPIEWVLERHFSLENQLSPTPARDLLKLHPLLFDERYSIGLGVKNAYNAHTTYTEVCILPYSINGLQKGRYTVIVGDRHIVKNEELIKDIQLPGGGTRAVSKIKFSVARYMRDQGFFWGRCPIDDAVDPQQRYNKNIAYADDVTKRGGPKVWIKNREADIDTSWGPEGSYQILNFETEDPNWHPRNATFPETPVTGAYYLPLINQAKQDIQEMMGPAPWQRGENLPGVKSARHLQILIEEQGKAKDPRDKSFKEFLETLCSHNLELEWAFTPEQREFSVEVGEGRFEKRSYVGTNLLGQTNVSIEMSGDFEKTLWEQEAIAEGLDKGYYGNVTSQLALHKIRKVMNLPEIADDIPRQVSRAEELVAEFGRHAKAMNEFDAEKNKDQDASKLVRPPIPAMDETVHDPGLWYEVLGSYWLGDECVEILDDIGWDGILILLAGWEKKLVALETQDDLLRSYYEGVEPGSPGKDGRPIGWVQHYMRLKAQRDQAVETAKNPPMGGQPMPINIPEIPEPPRGFVPADKAQRILFVWRDMLRKVGINIHPAGFMVQTRNEQIETPEGPAVEPKTRRMHLVLWPMLQFYAVIQQCRLVQKQRQQELLMGQPAVQSPAAQGE